MLKEYHADSSAALFCSRDTDIVKQKSTTLKDVNSLGLNEIPSWADFSNKEILESLPQYLQHLNEEQRCDIKNLLRQYEDVCSDNPRECSVISHDIELLPGTLPIRQNYYRTNFEKRKVDACDYGVGAVLLQEKPETNLLHPVSYYSCRLKKHQRSLSTVEKELLAIVQALQKYEVYVSTNNPITVYTDHNPLVFLNRARNVNQKILRWSLYLQNFNISVHHIRGQDNRIADALSRTPVPGNIVPS
ncbi:uncharacterized protein LOC135195748 [Macrobrachium nipponense]|uniref:uncharacterized protein LOC135195748 n=1 Tax=Macrobrachium nipponense TaxID=159736 RepID=UPI0030C7B00B